MAKIRRKGVQFRKPFSMMSADARIGWCMSMVSNWGMPLDDMEQRRLYHALMSAMEWGVRTSQRGVGNPNQIIEIEVTNK